ncbi:hypothetical protein F3Y22_tig00112349pilonHSYRG00018 [Hibiscus syriacus]|uniref:DUF3741 domain-containing protein n=1 Tax=Hibiscus syriacus TaxID=106335 RepID=A0A6A2X0A2_HIBSY|nr:hypothetical protein F3Y22_tig00112349pilonHSYRG00018 [Hibiscus syriacus]
MMIIISEQCGIQLDSDNEAEIQAFSRNQTMLQRHSRCNSDLQPHSRATSFRLSTCLVSTQDSREINRRPLNAIARLMGLESMPYSSSAGVEDNNPLLQPLRSNDPSMMMEATTWVYSEIVKRLKEVGFKEPANPAALAEILVEIPVKGPLKIEDKNPLLQSLRSNDPNRPTPICSEVEERWKDIEFKQPRQYLGALQHILEQLQAKGLLKTEHLVQKLGRLNSTHDEVSTDYIASLCENTNPDHIYISEILLASGLLLRDLGSDSTTFHLHPSGHRSTRSYSSFWSKPKQALCIQKKIATLERSSGSLCRALDELQRAGKEDPQYTKASKGTLSGDGAVSSQEIKLQHGGRDGWPEKCFVGRCIVSIGELDGFQRLVLQDGSQR